MKRILSVVLCLCLLAAASAAFADHAVEPTVEKAETVPPRAEFYIEEEGSRYAVGYQDPTLEIHITEGRYLDTAWYAARVKVAYPNQLRTVMFRDRYGGGQMQGELGSGYAQRTNAVLLINDDYFMSQHRMDRGAVIRQGVTYRMKCRGNADILGIDENGDFHVFKSAVNEDLEAFPGTLVNAFIFGPGLIIDGELQPVVADTTMGSTGAAQRMGIGQIGPLEYICLCCEGPEDKGSAGLTIAQFGELAASFGDVQTFYNLDGGQSTWMVFKGQEKNGEETFFAKINAQQNRNGRRQIGGAIYFVSAWLPGDDE